MLELGSGAGRDVLVLRGNSGWQTHDEAPTVGFILLVAGVAMVGFGKAFDDRQAETCSLRRPSGWRISPAELGEEPGDELRRHSRTVVTYPELDEVADQFSFDADGRLAVLEGVSHVVVQNAAEVRWIDDRDQLGSTCHGDGAQFFAVRLQIAGQGGGEPDVLGSGLLGFSFDSGRGEQVIGQTRQTVHPPMVTGGSTEILTDNWATLNEEERLKYLGAVNRGVDRLSRLTNDLLTSA